MTKRLDLVGKKFGRLTVVKYTGMRKYKSMWECRCDCGNIKTEAIGPALVSGTLKSCGCLHLSNAEKLNFKHGLRHHPLYSAVKGAYQRCTNPKHPRYNDWGGRGIEFRFDPWISAIKIIEDNLGLPGKGMTLNRIDNDGHYEVGNLNYATKKEQIMNRRKNKGTISIYRGVSTTTLKKKKWRSEFNSGGNYMFLGYFATELEAAEAYLQKYFEIHNKWPPEYRHVPLCYKSPLLYKEAA
jgi:hypothetical protein